MPFWNEVLEAQLPSLPTLALIRLETVIANDPSSSRTAEFEIFLTESLADSFTDDKLTACRADSTLSSADNEPVTLAISCSLDPALIAARQQGLWPIVTRGGLLKSAPTRSHRLQPPPEPGPAEKSESPGGSLGSRPAAAAGGGGAASGSQRGAAAGAPPASAAGAGAESAGAASE